LYNVWTSESEYPIYRFQRRDGVEEEPRRFIPDPDGSVARSIAAGITQGLLEGGNSWRDRAFCWQNTTL
jgi:hypothetical protein